MYEFLVLGQLSRGPMHGYRIAQILGYIMGPFRQVQWGALYPVLTRLERAKLIRAVEEVDGGEGRTKKVYAITEAGQLRLHEHLMDTEHHLGEYDRVFAHKVTLFPALTEEERIYLLRHYAVHAQQNIDHLLRKCAALSTETPHFSDAQRECVGAVLEHRLAHWHHERAWAEELLARLQHKEAV